VARTARQGNTWRAVEHIHAKFPLAPTLPLEAAFLAVHETVNSRGQVIVDGSLRFGGGDAAWLGGILAEHGAVWFEEPFEPDNIDAYVALKARTAVPLAAGENETSPRGLAELVRRRAVDIVQPDASRAGGISSVRQVAELRPWMIVIR
jgi:L-alanine-DL-glutamate epimerase-like enolase superfamily enzyme